MHDDEINAKQAATTPTKKSTASQPTASSAETKNTAGLLALQWLTYAFWGWTIFATIILTAILALIQFSGDVEGTSQPVVYGITAVLILLVISIICELFYARHEPKEKQGTASVVLVVHTIIFAILGVAGLIIAVFSLVNMLLNGFSSAGAKAALVSGGVAIVLYSLIFLRTIRPFIVKSYRKIFIGSMILAVIGMAVWGVAGPVVTTQRLKQDIAAKEVIETLNSTVQMMTEEDRTLPKTINQIVNNSEFNEDRVSDEMLDTLLDEKKLSYTPNVIPPTTETENLSKRVTYYYELCATFDHTVGSNKNQGRTRSNNFLERDGYRTYLPAVQMKEGTHCYRMKVTPTSDSATNNSGVNITSPVYID